MNGNRIVSPDSFLIPDHFIYLIDRKNAPLILHKKKEDIIFDRSQSY